MDAENPNKPSRFERAKQKISPKITDRVSYLRDKLAQGDKSPLEILQEEATRDPQPPLTPEELTKEFNESKHVRRLTPQRKEVKEPTLDEKVRGEIARIRNTVDKSKGLEGSAYENAKLEYEKERQVGWKPSQKKGEELSQEVKDEIAKRIKNRMASFDLLDESQKPQPKPDEISPTSESRATRNDEFGRFIKKMINENNGIVEETPVVEAPAEKIIIDKLPPLTPLHEPIMPRPPLESIRPSGRIPTAKERQDAEIARLKQEAFKKEWAFFEERRKQEKEYRNNPPKDKRPGEPFYSYLARKKFDNPRTRPANASNKESWDDYVLRGGPEELTTADPKPEKPRSDNPFASKNPQNPDATRELIAEQKKTQAKESQTKEEETEDEIIDFTTPKTTPSESAWAKLRNKFKRTERTTTAEETDTDTKHAEEFVIGGKNWEERLKKEQRNDVEPENEAIETQPWSWPDWDDPKTVTDFTPPPSQINQPDSSPDDTTEVPWFTGRRRQLGGTQSPSNPDTLTTNISKEKLLEKQSEQKGNNSVDALYESLSIPELESAEQELRIKNFDIYDSDTAALIMKIQTIRFNKGIEPAKAYIDIIKKNGVTEETVKDLRKLGFLVDVNVEPNQLINTLQNRKPREATISEKTKKELQAELAQLETEPANDTNSSLKKDITDDLAERDIDATDTLLRQYKRGWNKNFPMEEVLYKLTGNVPEALTPEVFEKTLQEIADRPRPLPRFRFRNR